MPYLIGRFGTKGDIRVLDKLRESRMSLERIRAAIIKAYPDHILVYPPETGDMGLSVYLCSQIDGTGDKIGRPQCWALRRR